MSRSSFVQAITRAAEPITGTSRASMRAIAHTVATDHGMKLAAMMDITRKERRISWPRQEAMRQIRARGYSLPQIKNFFGFKDHTTIIHGIKSATARAKEGARWK